VFKVGNDVHLSAPINLRKTTHQLIGGHVSGQRIH
jgi:hypothetical protein